MLSNRIARAVATTVTGAAVITAPLLLTSPAQAATRHTICANDLYVRDAPSGRFIGTLYYGDTFDVESTSGDWDYGMAWGGANKHGWVQRGWYC